MNKNKSTLGKSLIRDHKKNSHFVIKDGYRHTSDLPDGRDFACLNLNSVTEQTSLDDFLDKAELAEKEFNNEFSNIQIVDPATISRVLNEEEQALVISAQNKNQEILCIPRRPPWNQDTSKQELDAKEREMFLNWRKKLSELAEQDHINLTPYEKNLEVWRQLWRVIERSDVVVQIIDSRNPLLFRCLDLEAYVKEVDKKKLNVLLLNKADFLTEQERQCWSDYFESVSVRIVFFSALEQLQILEDENIVEDKGEEAVVANEIKNSTKVLSKEELIQFLKEVSKGCRADKNISTIGFVGYPNVGKSSTINVLLRSKKVSVSATPGKTKHFQTHIVDKELCLCDCPGLVFPNFVCSKAEMVINGILPIDQLTNWMQPVSLVTALIPKHILESKYSILIPAEEDGPPTAEQFLNVHGWNRGFMTQRGLPDNARSARYVLKDFVNGKLLYCYGPPNMKQSEYHKFLEVQKKTSIVPNGTTETEKSISERDRKFFQMSQGQVHCKGIKGVYGTTNTLSSLGDSNMQLSEKPWKKHHNKNKKEKLRRLYKDNPYDC